MSLQRPQAAVDERPPYEMIARHSLSALAEEASVNWRTANMRMKEELEDLMDDDDTAQQNTRSAQLPYDPSVLNRKCDEEEKEVDEDRKNLEALSRELGFNYKLGLVRHDEGHHLFAVQELSPSLRKKIRLSELSKNDDLNETDEALPSMTTHVSSTSPRGHKHQHNTLANEGRHLSLHMQIANRIFQERSENEKKSVGGSLADDSTNGE